LSGENLTGKADEKSGKADSNSPVMEFDEIRKILPHKEPFIFVDRVLEITEKERIVCLKNISGNDPWFCGHFPGYAIMPGALMIEALAQASIILVIKSYPGLENKLGVFSSVKARFSRPILPGDQVILEVILDKIISKGGVVSGVASIKGQKAVSATMTFGIVDKN